MAEEADSTSGDDNAAAADYSSYYRGDGDDRYAT